MERVEGHSDGMVGVDAKQGTGTTDALVGTVIHDRFRIIAPIARGGMGAVYKAEQAPLGRLVAIKVLSPKHDEEKDPEFRKRFFLEAATVAKLSHPNTVTVFDYGQSDGIYFIVMELLEGVTLKTALKRDGAFAPERAMQVTKQICRSLREAHRLGIIHRDMKPGNVMLLEQGDEKDYVKVLDFGLVKDIEADDEEDLTQAGVFMGSPKYMSPEQIQGERVDGRSDIYSVGVLLYEMVAGVPPFVREKQVQILMDHINSPLPPLPASVPLELAHVVERCLAKKREDRFPDMDALLHALKVVAGELALPSSAELGLSGDYPIGRTPVSGVHALSGDPLRTTSSGSISAPTITGVSGAVPAAPVEPPAPQGGSRTIAIVLGAVVLALAAAITVVAVDPFGAPDPAAPEAAPSPLRPAELPVVAAEPTVAEPRVEPVLRSVIVELDSQPPGAMVHVAEHEYGPTPAQVELTGALAEPGAELTFVFSVAGHRDTTIVRAVPASGPLEVSARLRRVARAPRRGGGGSAETPGQAVTPAGYRDSPY